MSCLSILWALMEVGSLLYCCSGINCASVASNSVTTHAVMLTFISGFVYCMEYLEKNIDWLEEKLKPLIEGRFKYLFTPKKLFS